MPALLWISIIISLALIIINSTHLFNTNMILSNSNTGNYFVVRNLPDNKIATNLLSEMNLRIKTFLSYLRHKFHNETQISRLIRYYNENQIKESHTHSNNTSFSLNKGQQMTFCLRNPKTNTLIDINTLMFVAIHELAHLMSFSVGHTPEFWNNMKFLLQEAINCPDNIYQYVDYKKYPVDYCGISINETPLNKII